MDVLVTGATGFIGRRLCAALAERGDRVRVLSRRPEAALREVPGAAAAFPTPPEGAAFPVEAVEGTDAVAHLMGESVAGGRWTEARKARIRGSRVATTRALVEAIRGAERPPGVLVSGSAIGYYGDRGDELLDEGSPPGDDFLAGVCRDWEAEALEARAAGTRVAVVRFGVVLGREGGALPRMLPPFRLGLGARLGSGRQWMSWIHADDVVGLILWAIDDVRVSGPVAAVAPTPVTNREFTAALARAVGRPALGPPVPAWAMRLSLGELAGALLGSQRVMPRVAQALGFRFRYPEIGAALGAEAGHGAPGR